MRQCPNCYVHCEPEDAVCHECGVALDGPDAGRHDPFIGRVIASKYELIALRGSGAMGRIYIAEQRPLGKKVCVKLLREELLHDRQIAERFQREARAASLLNHPNCISVTDFGETPEGLLYMAMDYIDGIDLADLLHREFPLDHVRIIHIVMQIACALDEAHARGIIHRDLKPENIMIWNRRNERDLVTVLDFGIAKITDRTHQDQRAFQTQAGIVCGTPEYMAPEQARGKELDARSDLYGLGVLLFQLLTNKVPFVADSAIEVVSQHLRIPPPRPTALRAEIPAALEDLTLALLEKAPEKRPPSALSVRDELLNIQQQLIAGEMFADERRDVTSPGGMSFEESGEPNGERTVIVSPPSFNDPGRSPREETSAPASDRRATRGHEPAGARGGRRQLLGRALLVVLGLGVVAYGALLFSRTGGEFSGNDQAGLTEEKPAAIGKSVPAAEEVLRPVTVLPEDPSEALPEDPGEALPEDLGEAPAEDPGETPSEDPGEAPAEDPGEAPAEDPGEAPAEVVAPVEIARVDEAASEAVRKEAPRRRAPSRAARSRQNAEVSRELEALGDAARGEGDFREAVRLYRKAWRAQRRAGLQRKLGQCHNALGEYEAGARHLQRYLDSLPSDHRERPLIERQIRR